MLDTATGIRNWWIGSGWKMIQVESVQSLSFGNLGIRTERESVLIRRRIVIIIIITITIVHGIEKLAVVVLSIKIVVCGGKREGPRERAWYSDTNTWYVLWVCKHALC